MYDLGQGVAQNHAEALRWYQLSAAQGNPFALFNVAAYHESGQGARKNKAAAIRWYRRAQAAGCTEAAAELRRMRA
jgi:TPR repeat protein